MNPAVTEMFKFFGVTSSSIRYSDRIEIDGEVYPTTNWSLAEALHEKRMKEKTTMEADVPMVRCETCDRASLGSGVCCMRCPEGHSDFCDGSVEQIGKPGDDADNSKQETPAIAAQNMRKDMAGYYARRAVLADKYQIRHDEIRELDDEVSMAMILAATRAE